MQCVGIGVILILLLAENYKNNSSTKYRMEGQLRADKNIRGRGVMNIEAAIMSEKFGLLTSKIWS